MVSSSDEQIASLASKTPPVSSSSVKDAIKAFNANPGRTVAPPQEGYPGGNSPTSSKDEWEAARKATSQARAAREWKAARQQATHAKLKTKFASTSGGGGEGQVGAGLAGLEGDKQWTAAGGRELLRLRREASQEADEILGPVQEAIRINALEVSPGSPLRWRLPSGIPPLPPPGIPRYYMPHSSSCSTKE